MAAEQKYLQPERGVKGWQRHGRGRGSGRALTRVKVQLHARLCGYARLDQAEEAVRGVLHEVGDARE